MANKRGERPPSAPDALTAAGINRYVDEHGLEALFDYLHARYPRRRRGGAGRPMIDDTKRVARLEYHLLNDSDLIALLNRAGRASRAPSQRFSDARRAAREAARRATKDCPQLPGDIRADGTVRAAAVDRLLDKLLFGFDAAAAAGFDLGVWET